VAQNRPQRKLPQRERVTAGEMGDRGGLRTTTARQQLSSDAIRLGDSAVRFFTTILSVQLEERGERRLKGSLTTMTDCCAISADHHRRHSTPSSVTKSRLSADLRQRVRASAVLWPVGSRKRRWKKCYGDSGPDLL